LTSGHASTAFSRRSKRSEVFFDHDHKNAEWDAINARLGSPEVWQDQKTSQALQQKKKRLEKDIQFFKQILAQKEELEVLTELASEGENVESEIEAGINRLEKNLQEGELRTLFYDEDDPRNAILTIHPGAGGTESHTCVQVVPDPQAADEHQGCDGDQ